MPLLLLRTAALAVQRQPEDPQRYRRDDTEPYGQRDQPKPDEYECDEGAEDHCDGCNPGVEPKRLLPLDRRLIGTGATGARDCAPITLLPSTPAIHAFWVPGERLLNAPLSRRRPAP